MVKLTTVRCRPIRQDTLTQFSLQREEGQTEVMCFGTVLGVAKVMPKGEVVVQATRPDFSSAEEIVREFVAHSVRFMEAAQASGIY